MIQYKHFLRGAPQPDDENVNASLHPPDERLLEEMENTVTRSTRYSLQLQDSQDIEATPAEAAGLADRAYSLDWIVDLIDQRAPKPGPRGPYKSRKTRDTLPKFVVQAGLTSPPAILGVACGFHELEDKRNFSADASVPGTSWTGD